MRSAALVSVSFLAASALATPPSYLEIPLPSGCDLLEISGMNADGNVAIGTGRFTGTTNLTPAIAYNFGGVSSSAYTLGMPAPYVNGTADAVNTDGSAVLCTMWYSVQSSTTYGVGVYRGGNWSVITMPAFYTATPSGMSDDGTVAYGSVRDGTLGFSAPAIPTLWFPQTGSRSTLPLPMSPEGQLTSGHVCCANITSNGGILLGLGYGNSGRNYIIRWIVTPFGVDTSIITLPWSSLTPTDLVASRDAMHFGVLLFGMTTGFGNTFGRIATRETLGTEWTTIMPTFEYGGLDIEGMSGDGSVVVGSAFFDKQRPFAWRGATGTDLWQLASQAGITPNAPLGAFASAMNDNATVFAGTLRVSNSTARGFFLVADVPEAPIPCDADFNRDGFVDGFDYDDFVRAFETGCP